MSAKINKYGYLTGEQILPFNWRKIIEQAKFTYSHLWKALEKPKENQVGALKLLDPANQNDELKEIKSIFPQRMMKDLIYVKLKKTR